ncbi:MAG: TatD DNase family protein [Cellvibrionaceae bacterium]|jgi:TatD DNase family protein
MLVDSHCHLDRLNLDKYDQQLASAIDAAQLRGVEKLLCVGISTENRKKVVEIAEKYSCVVASVGVHPLDVQEGLASVSDLVDWSQHDKVVALGETGLDYHYGEEDRDLQRKSFITHLQAAKQARLPVIVHTRDARKDTIDLIDHYGCHKNAGVLHCFTESVDMAKQAIDMNYLISFSGIITFRNAQALKEVAREIPLEHLLIETDSPYLAPVPYRGKPNEPQYVREVAEYLADLKGIPLSTLAEVTTENFYRLFPKAKDVTKAC